MWSGMIRNRVGHQMCLCAYSITDARSFGASSSIGQRIQIVRYPANPNMKDGA